MPQEQFVASEDTMLPKNSFGKDKIAFSIQPISKLDKHSTIACHAKSKTNHTYVELIPLVSVLNVFIMKK